MASAPLSALVVLSLLGCKREVEPATHRSETAPQPAAPHDAGAAGGQAWYRAIVRAADGVEARFFLRVPAPGAPGQALIKVGDHELGSDATFDGKTLKMPFTVYLTAVEATVGQDGSLGGSFTTSWRAWGASSITFTATKVAAPVTSALATVDAAGAALDLGAPRSVWRIAMAESGVAKLVVDQTAPGDFTGLLLLDTGNIIYLAGNGRGDAIVLSGFDGTAGYRLELALGADRRSPIAGGGDPDGFAGGAGVLPRGIDRTRADGKFFGGQRFDWRESLTATRGADFALAMKPKAKRAGARIELPPLPASPELAALGRGPLVIEMAGSWCSTCKNAAPFLVDLYREFGPRGLNMVTLLYDFTDDRVIDAQQAEAFKNTYGVTWPVVPVQGGIDDFAESMPSGLADIDPGGFPITLFLAADRSLVALHAGFPAADAADEFRRVTAEFRATIETLLARSVDIHR